MGCAGSKENEDSGTAASAALHLGNDHRLPAHQNSNNKAGPSTPADDAAAEQQKPVDAAQRFKQQHGLPSETSNDISSNLRNQPSTSSGPSNTLCASGNFSGAMTAATMTPCEPPQQTIGASPAPISGGAGAVVNPHPLPLSQQTQSTRNTQCVNMEPEDLVKDVQHLTWLGQGAYGAVYQGERDDGYFGMGMRGPAPLKSR